MKTDNEYGHDFANPLSNLDALEVAWLAADSRWPRCPYCKVTHRMVPMTGTAWGLDVIHEEHCPDHDDNLAAVEASPDDLAQWPTEPPETQ